MFERTVAATVHGRYLTAPADVHGPAPLFVGFHGYAENAETQLDRLCAVPGSARWLKVSIQALHPFYQRRTDTVVANWMTRQQRDLAISDNIAYVAACLDTVASEYLVAPHAVFAGFSQGVAMAFRATASRTAAGVIAVGGDVPPELTPAELRGIPAVLLLRGASDPFYSKDTFASDQRRLRDSAVRVEAVEFDGGHEWSPEVVEAATRFLQARYESSVSF